MSGEAVSTEELISQCHPLGKFKESILKAITAFSDSPQYFADLYTAVLVDTPVGMAVFARKATRDQLITQANTLKGF